MMLTTTVVAVGAAAVSYLVRFGERNDKNTDSGGHMLFMIFVVAGPLILAIVVSLIRAAVIAWTRPRKQKQKR